VTTAKPVPTWLTPLLATACGLIVANIYYAQPLAGPISHALGLPPAAAGLIVTMTQAGYGLGLLLVVPLGDLLENRALVRVMVVLSALALVGAGLSTSAAPFLACALLIGVGSVAVQVLVPYASHLAAEAERGRVVGKVMGGLMIGIMLARPAASLIADLAGWRTVFLISAGLMVAMAVVLSRLLPPRRPEHRLGYGALMASMAHLMATTPLLRRRALYQAAMFGAFSVFWTATPLLLTGPQYHLSQTGVALFALVGAAGAVSAPLTGRWADKGLTRIGSALAMTAACAAFLISRLAPGHSMAGVVVLALAGVMLDFAVTANLVFGQRAIFVLSAHHRSRMNGLYMATFFVGGAIASALAGWSYARGGWAWTSLLGAGLPLLALAYFATEPKTLLPVGEKQTGPGEA
jgi:predicted MFS family arabinose efflux permease